MTDDTTPQITLPPFPWEVEFKSVREERAPPTYVGGTDTMQSAIAKRDEALRGAYEALGPRKPWRHREHIRGLIADILPDLNQ